MEENIVYNEFLIRNLQKTDFFLGFLNFLPENSDFDEEAFIKNFEARENPSYVNIVAEHVESGRIVGLGTILIEQKFIRGGKKVGHLEELIVKTEFRRQGLARKMISVLFDLCKRNNCYKVILSASQNNEEFFNKFGFTVRGLNMEINLDNFAYLL